MSKKHIEMALSFLLFMIGIGVVGHTVSEKFITINSNNFDLQLFEDAWYLIEDSYLDYSKTVKIDDDFYTFIFFGKDQKAKGILKITDEKQVKFLEKFKNAIDKKKFVETYQEQLQFSGQKECMFVSQISNELREQLDTAFLRNYSIKTMNLPIFYDGIFETSYRYLLLFIAFCALGLGAYNVQRLRKQFPQKNNNPIVTLQNNLYSGYTIYAVTAVLFVFALPWAVSELFNRLENTEPVVISLDQFTTKEPDKNWYHLLDCYIDYTQYVCIDHDYKEEIKYLYVALYPKEENVIQVITEVIDSDISRVLKKAQSIKNQQTKNEYLAKYQDSLKYSGTKKISIRYLDRELWQKLQHLFAQQEKKLASNCVLVEKEHSNTISEVVVIIVIGIISLAFLLFMVIKIFVFRYQNNDKI